MVMSVLAETFKNDEFLKISILTCFTIFHFFHFLGRRHEALAFKSAPCPLAHQCVLGILPYTSECAEKVD